MCLSLHFGCLPKRLRDVSNSHTSVGLAKKEHIEEGAEEGGLAMDLHNAIDTVTLRTMLPCFPCHAHIYT